MSGDGSGTATRGPRRSTRLSFPMPRVLRRMGLGGLLLGLLTSAVAAQDSVIVIDPDEPAADSGISGLPPDVLLELLTTWNDSATVRLPGGLTLPAGATLSGPVASFRGTLRVAGEIAGTLTVINGDLVLLPGAIVRGGILVAGGRLTVAPGAVHEGEARVYWDAAPVTRQSDGGARHPRAAPPDRRARDGGADLPVRPDRHHAPAHHHPDLQPDRGPGDRLRAGVRVAARSQGERVRWISAASCAPRRTTPPSVATSAGSSAPTGAFRARAASASAPGPTRSSPASRSTPCRETRSAGTPSCCSATTGTTSPARAWEAPPMPT